MKVPTDELRPRISDKGEGSVLRDSGTSAKSDGSVLRDSGIDALPVGENGKGRLRAALDDAERQEIVATLKKTNWKVAGPNWERLRCSA